MTIYLFATLDTKGHEAGFVRDRLKQLGAGVKVVDCSCLGEPHTEPDINREQLFAAAGTTPAKMREGGDRGAAVTKAAEGAAAIAREAHASGELTGVLGIGGSAGTTIGTAAMRVLPLGVPKLMVSTLASGSVRGFVGDKDIMMLNSVVDIAGVNRISRLILSEAAAAMAGMVRAADQPPTEAAEDKPLIAATMFGVTTPCVEQARKVLEAAGFEVLVFHATGAGGQAMETLIDDGLIAGVLDVTTTELADELVGGVLSAGPDRLTAAGRRGIPQVVSVGATDMVNFGPRETVPEKFAQRQFHIHNANVTLMRTTPEECAAIGRDIARKVAAADGPATIVLPLRGVSAIDCNGQPFEDSEARQSLFDAICSEHGVIELIERDEHINDESFAKFAAEKLISLIRSNGGEPAT